MAHKGGSVAGSTVLNVLVLRARVGAMGGGVEPWPPRTQWDGWWAVPECKLAWSQLEAVPVGWSGAGLLGDTPPSTLSTYWALVMISRILVAWHLN